MDTTWVSKEEPHDPITIPIPRDLPEIVDGHEHYAHGPEGTSDDA